MGRPDKLTPERQAAFLEKVEAGLPYTVACSVAGFDYKSFDRYRKKGQAAKRGKFRRFWEAVQAAEARAQARLMANWQQEAKEDWRAARSYLARRWPSELGHLEPPRRALGEKLPSDSIAGRQPIQIISAIPRPERPTEPPLTLAQRMAMNADTREPAAGGPTVTEAGPTEPAAAAPTHEPRDPGI